MTKQEAQKALEEVGLNIELRENEADATIITEQLPKAGIKIKEGTSVIAYY